MSAKCKIFITTLAISVLVVFVAPIDSAANSLAFAWLALNVCVLLILVVLYVLRSNSIPLHIFACVLSVACAGFIVSGRLGKLTDWRLGYKTLELVCVDENGANYTRTILLNLKHAELIDGDKLTTLPNCRIQK